MTAQMHICRIYIVSSHTMVRIAKLDAHREIVGLVGLFDYTARKGWVAKPSVHIRH
jgi:hypothetical protein